MSDSDPCAVGFRFVAGVWDSKGHTGTKGHTVDRARTDLAALEQTNWRVAGARGAAGLLGVHPATLTSRMKKMDFRRPS